MSLLILLAVLIVRRSRDKEGEAAAGDGKALLELPDEGTEVAGYGKNVPELIDPDQQP